MFEPSVQCSRTTTEAASVAATPALESRTPVVTAPLAKAKADARQGPDVPSRIQSTTLTVEAVFQQSNQRHGLIHCESRRLHRRDRQKELRSR